MREKKIEAGWIPGKKHVSIRLRKCERICKLTVGDFSQKAAVSLASHDTSSEIKLLVAEESRPRRNYKEDARKRNKPCGRKRLHEPTKSKLTNWFSPFLWSQIETAAEQAGNHGHQEKLLDGQSC